MIATIVSIDKHTQTIRARVRRNTYPETLATWDEALKVGQRIEVERRVNNPYLHIIKR